MPGGDRTGPAGMGPMTGRAMGYCAGYTAPGFASPGFGRGYFGMGRGRGWRNRYYATGMPGWQRAAMPPAYGAPYAAPPQAANPQMELDALKRQAEYFEQALQQIKQQMENLQAQANATTDK